VAQEYQAQQQSVENMLNFCTKIHMYMVHILLTNHEEYLNFYLENYKVYIFFELDYSRLFIPFETVKG